MATTLLHKQSSTSGVVPTTSDLALGEIGINTYDGKMFIKKDDGTASIVDISGTSISVIDNLTSTSTTDALSANMGKSLEDNKAAKTGDNTINFKAADGVASDDVVTKGQLDAVGGGDADTLDGHDSTYFQPVSVDTTNFDNNLSSSDDTVQKAFDTLDDLDITNYTSKRESFTASAGQTSFTVSGGYTASFADVYMNGSKLLNGTDVDISSGTTVDLATGASSGDIIDVVAYGTFSVADTYTKGEIDGGNIVLTAIKTVDGSGSGLDADLLDGYDSDVNATADTVVVRDSSGEINGTASSAKYADLAEKYISDDEYPEGTVMAIGGDKEITKYTSQSSVAGIISIKPGFKLNKESMGQYIALKGKVPCLINGSAKKGDFIIADNNGKGRAVSEISSFTDQNLLLGISLETSNDRVMIKV